jgi:hypothetical protein
MRLDLPACFIPAVLVLAACSSSAPPKLDAPVPAPSAVSLNKVGSTLDVIDSRVAAAAVVARELNKAGQPAKVDAELSVASAHLPAPSPGDLAFARQRALTSSTAEYDAQLKKAAEKQKAMEAAWLTLESQAAANRKAVVDRDARIADLTAEVDRARREASRSIWTVTGAALAVIGALCTAFVGPRVGVPLLLCGAFAGSVPFIIESRWFNWIAGGTAGVVACIGIWFIFDLVRDKVNAPHPADGPPKE